MAAVMIVAVLIGMAGYTFGVALCRNASSPTGPRYLVGMFAALVGCAVAASGLAGLASVGLAKLVA